MLFMMKCPRTTERPSAIFNRHVKVVPYPEDDTVALAEQLGGTEALVMGSDWPHAEGLREPADFSAASRVSVRRSAGTSCATTG